MAAASQNAGEAALGTGRPGSLAPIVPISRLARLEPPRRHLDRHDENGTWGILERLDVHRGAGRQSRRLEHFLRYDDLAVRRDLVGPVRRMHIQRLQ